MENIGDQILLFFAAFGSIAAAVLAAFSLWDRFKAAKKPHDDHIAMVERHEEKLVNDFEVIKDMQAELRLLIENDLLIIDHIINGNHIDEFRARREFIQRYLIDKS